MNLNYFWWFILLILMNQLSFKKTVYFYYNNIRYLYFYYDNIRYLWWTLGTQKPFRPQSYGTWKSIYPRVVHSPSCVTWPRWFLQVTRVCGPAPPVNSWWRKRITRSCTSKKRWEWVVCCKLSTSDG